MASYYRKEERNGIFTPDENIQIKINGDYVGDGIKGVIDQVIKSEGTGKVIVNAQLIVNGSEIVGQNIKYEQWHEDGLLLCLSTQLSRGLMNKFKSKVAVVKIVDIDRLKTELDSQIGVESIVGLCHYTSSEERNNFLKSISDSWQEEYRLFWKDVEGPKDVQISSGIAIDVTHLI